MRLADLAPTRKQLTIAILAVAVLALLRWIDREDEQPTTPTTQALVTVHFKLRPGAQVAFDSQPVFRHFRSVATAGDPRLQWRRAEMTAAQLERLQRDPNIESAYAYPVHALPRMPVRTADDSCPIKTPSFEKYQGYLGAAPEGIDAPAAWRRGVRGQGIWFADIEGNWNAQHEDLPGARITHAGGELIEDQSWRAHGTAVLGEVVGVDNGKGVVGIAPDVERVFTSSIGDTSVADAIDVAASNLRPGDVLLIELQGLGPRGAYLPEEYWDDNFDVIQLHARRGIVIIEAAGNGFENLDHKAYGGKLTRGKRDSGAIMIGAGGPARPGFTDRERLDFSNYGSRVDVQGWGRRVATLDYGDLQYCSGGDSTSRDRDYTDEFAGTSSASPIVAGAAILLESYAKAKGRVLSPAEVRHILSTTGSPQVNEDGEHIGPRPDLARALRALE